MADTDAYIWECWGGHRCALIQAAVLVADICVVATDDGICGRKLRRILDTYPTSTGDEMYRLSPRRSPQV